MARDAVSITSMTNNAGTAVTGTTITPTNGQSVAGGGKYRNLVLHVKNSGGTAGTVTISAGGAYSPAWRKGVGAIAVTVPANGERLITVESARVVQSDGSIYLDFTPASMVGTTAAYRLPADL
jgi:hypothetical protein